MSLDVVVVVRGDQPGSTRSEGDSFKYSPNVTDAIGDHLTGSWSIDDVLEIWSPGTSRVTIQYSLLYEPLNGIIEPSEGKHGFGPLLGGRAQEVSFHHNVVAHIRRRGPRVSDQQVKIVQLGGASRCRPSSRPMAQCGNPRDRARG